MNAIDVRELPDPRGVADNLDSNVTGARLLSTLTRMWLALTSRLGKFSQLSVEGLDPAQRAVDDGD